jgi:hypothetical protein
VKVDVYRSCSWREKREVLGVFWSPNVETTARLGEAALQYGYYAIICLVAVMLELALILVVALERNALVAALTVLAEVFMLWSTWWAFMRYRTLKSQFSTERSLSS